MLYAGRDECRIYEVPDRLGVQVGWMHGYVAQVEIEGFAFTVHVEIGGLVVG